VIRYDFPLNERVRVLLRLEDLYAKLAHFTDKSSSTDHQAALNALFDILVVASRADLKSELLQELERQKRSLAALHNNPEISEDALQSVLSEIEAASGNILAMTGKFGQHLRENEWLMGINNRVCIPGGAGEFDLPSYHYWLHQEATLRRNYLKAWLAPMLPIRDGLAIVLRLLRDGGKTQSCTATRGCFQQMPGGRVAQMLRISLADDLPCIPEVSANKYALNIRFVSANYVAKTTLYEQDVAFELTACSL
jgi:cell division protein ZapD